MNRDVDLSVKFGDQSMIGLFDLDQIQWELEIRPGKKRGSGHEAEQAHRARGIERPEGYLKKFQIAPSADHRLFRLGHGPYGE